MFKTIVDSGLKTVTSLNVAMRGTCFRASLGVIKRPTYSRMYPVTLVNPDGSSITIKYHEPIAIIQLPYDINQMSETEKKRRMLKRQMTGKTERKTTTKTEILDRNVKFDPKKYLNLTKKK
ncbi:unnamed protein product [Brachionus calyciflorus]|uniref:39S ribosomal protein L55, mitochondrial n=1 Tax=Brachionus calyciflorus TaxID=104777 RepID=A0A813NX79_9BILA|nr:unnamed protein product [Brachionus calyciflorus]